MQDPIDFQQRGSTPNPAQQVLPNATAVLVLGIISLVICGIVGLVCGIIALSLAGKSKALYESNPGIYTASSFSNLNAGRTCALIGTIFSSIVLVFLVVYFIIILTVAGSMGAFH
jgi:hypothetical protein